MAGGGVQVAAPQRFVALLLAAGQSLAPLIRRFVSLGLNRVWLHSGDAIYRCSTDAQHCAPLTDQPGSSAMHQPPPTQHMGNALVPTWP